MPRDLVPLALTALDKHSQNNMIYDPNKAENVTQAELDECDGIMEWRGIQLSSRMSFHQFEQILSL